MQIVLPDVETRVAFEIGSERPMNDEEYFQFCARNRKLRIERDANGEIVIMPPTGLETGNRNSDLNRQLGNWARADGRGIALDSNTEYMLPNGAPAAPDPCWLATTRLDQC